jgi:hypothetical protein
MSEQLQQNYNEARDFLFDRLSILDVYKDGIHEPQSLPSAEWVQLDSSPGLYIKNLTLYKPSSFVISLLHGVKGASSNGKNYSVSDDLEMHCITGQVIMNGFLFKSHNVWNIPAATEYTYEYLEDTYLTVKFIPKNNNNFTTYPIITN